MTFFSTSEKLEIDGGAQFFSNVAYWTDEGEIDFGNSLQNGEATYDESLSFEGNDYAAEGFLIGISIFFIVCYLLGGFVLLLLLEWAFGATFNRAATEVTLGWTGSLGIGLVYIIGTPILILMSIALIVGIPFGILTAVIYFYSLIFGSFMTALILTHIWKSRNDKTWNVFVTSLLAFLLAMAIQALTSIPFIGPLVSFVLLCLTYGAIILAIRSRKKGSAGAQGPVEVTSVS